MIVKPKSLLASALAPALLVVSLVGDVSLLGRGQEKGASEVAFERLKSLAGTWESTEKGSTRKSTTTYALTGGGSVLIESMGGMATAYHLDKGSLVLTHFCGAGNQPRMRAKTIENGGRHLVFEMYDITNHPDPNAYYTKSLDVSFLDDGRVELVYRGTTAGRESSQTFQLLRRTTTSTSQQ